MGDLTADDLRRALAVAALEFDEAEVEMMRPRVQQNHDFYESLRRRAIDYRVPPALVFAPTAVAGALDRNASEPELPAWQLPDPWTIAPETDDLQWADIGTVASLLKAGRVTSRELVQASLDRLRAVDPILHAVVTLFEDEALERADVLDAELRAGMWRGPLHGIPWGAKDILARRGAPTTWGTEPFDTQVFDHDATVVERLEAAGAVLVAKLSTGQLAMGDLWFGGRTRNPWDPEQGSSGSSAGPASATAAGGVMFSVGSETIGSIISPSSVCGCTGFRPTFGRVSRFGAMALSWSFDKLGPICRSVDDAALVFAAIQGPDGRDPSVVNLPFDPPGETNVAGWKVGYLVDDADGPLPAGTTEALEQLGVELVPVTIPKFSLRAVMVAASAEQGAAFDDLTRSPDLARVVTQEPGGWPDTFRMARLIPAVEYLRVQRDRTEIVTATEAALADVAAVVHPSPVPNAEGQSAVGQRMVVLGNYTGHPTIAVPGPLREDGTPTSVSFTGRLGGDATLLAVAAAWQRATGHHHRHPTIEA